MLVVFIIISAVGYCRCFTVQAWALILQGHGGKHPGTCSTTGQKYCYSLILFGQLSDEKFLRSTW